MYYLWEAIVPFFSLFFANQRKQVGQSEQCPECPGLGTGLELGHFFESQSLEEFHSEDREKKRGM